MFEGLFQPMHLLVILFICLLIFGPKKLADLGKGMGEGIRGFKDAMKEEPKPQPTVTASTTTTVAPPATTTAPTTTAPGQPS
jgi:sec-independent protein translocase protein TatA